MANIDVGFSFRTGGSNAIFAQGTITLDDQTGIVGNISGTIDGNTIQGLSTYRGASNILQKEAEFVARGGYYYHWRADVNGLSFSDNSLQYNLSGTGNGFGKAAQFGDTLYASDGTSRTTDFYTSSGFQPVCFADGTRIRTTRGEIAVEDLRVGDRAIVAGGAVRPITWIGHRRLDGAGTVLPQERQPIRIRAGAFGPGLPHRDLLLSPGHPVLVGADADGAGGVLVPIMCLINGTTIAREPATAVTYWHIELDAHDLLLAEGLAAESYYDMGSRVWFAGRDGMLVDPDLVPTGEHGRCRPVAVDGPAVEAERARLSGVFAASLGAACAWDAPERYDWLAA